MKSLYSLHEEPTSSQPLDVAREAHGGGLYLASPTAAVNHPLFF